MGPIALSILAVCAVILTICACRRKKPKGRFDYALGPVTTKPKKLS